MSSSLLNYIFQAALLGLIVFFLLGAISSPASARRGASRITLRGTSDLEAEFFNDLKNQKISRWSLSDAFFIASGIRDNETLERARSWHAQVVSEAREAIREYRSTKDKADHLLRWLHTKIFKSYRARSTDAVEVMRFGRFNCLSSCIVYGMVAEELGLNVRGIAVDEHAFCRVYPNKTTRNSTSMKSRSGGWDVETTTKLGFNPGRSIQLDRAVVSVPRSRYRNRREISLWEMIGLIYTNHIGMTRAYPTDEDRLLAYQKAALFFPRDQVIQHNILAAHTQVVQGYASRRKWGAARVYLEQMTEFDDRDKYTSALWLQVAEQNLDEASRGGLDEAISTLTEYRAAAEGLPKSAWYYLEAQLYARAAAHLYQRGEAKLAMEHYVQSSRLGAKAEGLRQRSRSRSLSEALTRLRYNHLALLKNYIIKLFNERLYEEAGRAVQVASSSYRLDQDLKRLQREISTAKSRQSISPRDSRSRRSTRQTYTRTRRGRRLR